MKDYMNTSEIAEYLGIDEDTVKMLGLPHIRMGKHILFVREEIQEFTNTYRDEERKVRYKLAQDNSREGQKLLSENQFEEAYRCYRTAIENNDSSPEDFFNLAFAAYSLGKYREALTAIERAILMKPWAVWTSEALEQKNRIEELIAGGTPEGTKP